MPEGTDRVTVSSYVPAEQRQIWTEEADDLGMSQSEFIRTMVQAGRRGFSLAGEERNPLEPDVAGSHPGGNGVRTAVLKALREQGPLDWEALFGAVVGDLEEDLEAVVAELMEEGRIDLRPSTGEYSVAEAADGD